jgi:hypothetical protein
VQGRAARRTACRIGGQADQGGRGAGGAGQDAMTGGGAACRSILVNVRVCSGPGLKARRALSVGVCWGVSTDAPMSAVNGVAGPR